MTGTETAEPAEPLGGAEQVDSKERELTKSVKMLRDTQKQLSQATYDCSQTTVIIMLFLIISRAASEIFKNLSCFSLKILGGGGDSQSFQMAALTTDGANVMDGTKMTMTSKELHISRTESPGPAKMVGAKKKYRSRSASASSLDSASSGSYTGQSSSITLWVQ